MWLRISENIGATSLVKRSSVWHFINEVNNIIYSQSNIATLGVSLDIFKTRYQLNQFNFAKLN